MATELKSNTQDTEMVDDEKVVTMMDVLQEQEDFEEDANAVLGASDDKNCTYSEGYIKRQAIYACMTCCAEAKNDPTKRAGVCLACSLTCHENHELIELYTKRNFKCDCGNVKFNSHPCQFTPHKVDINENNSYNQNFSGVYCICHRPYPDPESTLEDEMIQCIICEDWLHTSHLEAPIVPDHDQYSEMICKSCMDKNDFLYDYSNLAVNIENGACLALPNKIENVTGKMCNGDDKVNEMTDMSSEFLNVNPTVVETVEEQKELNVSTTESSLGNLEEITDNKDITEIDNKNDDDNETKKEFSIETEKSNIVVSMDMPMETDEANQLDFNNADALETNSVNPVNEESDKCANNDEHNMSKEEIIEETINNICSISEGNTENNESHNDSSSKDTITEVLTSETFNEEQQNENKVIENNLVENDSNVGNGPVTENELKIIASETEHATTEMVTEPECIEKSAEQIEEDRLLADPEDANDGENKKNKVNLQISDTNNVNDKSSESEAIQSGGTVIEKSDEIIPSKLASDLINKEDELINIVSVNTEHETDIKQTDVIIKGTGDENTTTVVGGSKDDLNENNVSEIETEHFAILSVENEDKTENNFDPNVQSPSNNKCQSVEIPSSNEKSLEKRKHSLEENNDLDVKKPKLDEIYSEPCVRPKRVYKAYKGATFWPSTFRQKLCNCSECLSMYKDLSVLFLIDPEDTVTAYENLGKQKTSGRPASQYEKGLQALSSLDRIQQINALTEYNKMRDKLLDFLKSFKDRKEVVKEEDIKAFFAGMKPKREPDGVYFCR